MATYNPFPEQPAPTWVNSGTCYSTAWYDDEKVAQAVAAIQQAKGGTVNGGYLHGEPLGQIIPSRTTDGEPQWGVTF